jgi:hypothetical protein
VRLSFGRAKEVPMLPTFRLVTLALALSAPAGGGDHCPSLGALKPPSVPAALQPPAGASLMLRYRAEGTQIYTCKATTGAATAFAWSFKAPQATLMNDGCQAVGTHFAGPTWKASADDSAVVGSKVAEAPAPAAGAVPWLLLKAASTTGQGLMNAVVAVQRVDTVGGVAPAGQCSAATAGREIRVPYSATYYFYKN